MGLHGRLSGGGTLRGRLRSASGGNTFTMHPVYNTGLKIADYEEDGEAGELYIPIQSEGIDLSNKTWNLITSTTGTSSSAPIPDDTKYLAVIARDNNNNKITMLSVESIDNINKILEVTGYSTYILGGYWKDQAGSDYGDASCQINNGNIVAYSSYHTNTTYVYALS